MIKCKRTILALCLAFPFFVVSAAMGEEVYSSQKFDYPTTFENNSFDKYNNDMRYLDVVSYANMPVVFFTMYSNFVDGDGRFIGGDYMKYVYYFIPNSDFIGQIDIGNTENLDFKIKVCVFDEILYLFYSPTIPNDKYPGNYIYYRTLTPNADVTEREWTGFNASDMKQIELGQDGAFCFAETMNDELYVFYSTLISDSAGEIALNYAKSSDGETFAIGENQFAIDNAMSMTSCHGTVFQVPDTENGCDFKMAISYVLLTTELTQAANCLFFDGDTFYGNQSIAFTESVLGPSSIRLCAGSADEYVTGKYSIQAWCASPSDDQYYYDIYHAEYIPKGGNGDEGSWSGWTKLDITDDDRIKSKLDGDAAWSVASKFLPMGPGVKAYLNLWYGTGTNFNWGMTRDTIQLRCSSYGSDWLEAGNTLHVSAQEQSDNDLSAFPILGVIQGTPPFPVNDGNFSDSTSTVEFGCDKTTTIHTHLTIGSTVTVSYGKKFLKGKLGLNFKISAGLRYSSGDTSRMSLQKTQSLYSWSEPTPGDIGWVMVFKPEIYNEPYILRSWDGSALTYDGSDNTDDNQFSFSLISFGQNSEITFYAYNLLEPDQNYSYSSIFAGMSSMPLSTEVEKWRLWSVKMDQSPQKPYSLIKMPSISSTSGESAGIQIGKQSASMDSYAPHGRFTAKESAFGFTGSESISVNYSLRSSTEISHNLGFYYNIPNDDSAGEIAYMEITPCLLTPNSNECSWLSTDIKENNKPKPWLLTYYVGQPAYYTGSSSSQEAYPRKINASCHFRFSKTDKDTLKVSATVQDIPDDFSFDSDTSVSFRIGNYLFDSESFNADSNDEKNDSPTVRVGKNKLEISNSKRFLRLHLNHKTHTITVKAEMKHSDLSCLESYGLSNKTTEQKEGEVVELPVSLIIGNRVYCESSLGVVYKSKQNHKGHARGKYDLKR